MTPEVALRDTYAPLARFGRRRAIVLAVLLPLAGCGDRASPVPANAGGSPAGTGSSTSGGAGGLSAGGMSTSAVGIGGSGVGGMSVSAAGTGGSGPTSGMSGSKSTIPATFDTLKTVINDAPCFGAGCHNDDQNPLDLRVDDQLYARLTSRISQNCGALPIVNPGKPHESALVKILSGPCGATPRMPLGCVDDQDSNCLPADYIRAITEWITLGALPQ